MKRMMFTKHLQSLPITEAIASIAELGFEGVDLTVRPSGYVKPERVRQELARIASLADSFGMKIPLLTTDIIAAGNAATDTFETAASLGIGEIKLGYQRYGDVGTFRRTLEQMQRDLDGIEKLAQSSRIRANLHIHSGDHMTAQSAIVWELIRDRDPAAIGAYVDPGHMVIEGGRDGWRQGLDLLGDRITLVAVKDMSWEPVEGTDPGKPAWKPRVVPLRSGSVPWPSVFEVLRQVGFDGWISVHAEYAGLAADQVLAQTRDDLNYLQTAMHGPETAPDKQKNH